MSRPKISSYILSVFQPLIDTSQLSNLSTMLKTAHLHIDNQKSQFRRIKALSYDKEDLLHLNNQSFIAKFNCENEIFLVFDVENLGTDEKESIQRFMISEGLTPHYLEDCFFCFSDIIFQSIIDLIRHSAIPFRLKTF